MNACSPAGTGAVIFGDVTGAENWGGRGLGRGGGLAGGDWKNRDPGLI